MQTYFIHENKDLKPYNTFGIQVASRFFSAIKNTEELRSLLQNPTFKNMPIFLLGGGSNVLFTQNFSGLVIKNEIKGIDLIKEDNDHIWLRVGAGENWHELVMHCVNHGYGGIENLSLIPGTVGAAPIQNIGAYGVELKDVFHQLEAMRVDDGALVTFSHQQCEFGYRDSVFKTKFKNQFVITHVTLRLLKKPNFNISYGALQEVLQKNNISELTLKAVSDAVMTVRRSKLPDPQLIGNAGSFFKNPVIPESDFHRWQNKFPTIPHFSTNSADFVKISAGWLIEQCGWKGKRQGDVGTYDKQALVIVNYGSGTGAAIQQFAQQIQQSVFDTFRIQLTPEVNII